VVPMLLTSEADAGRRSTASRSATANREGDLRFAPPDWLSPDRARPGDDDLLSPWPPGSAAERAPRGGPGGGARFRCSTSAPGTLEGDVGWERKRGKLRGATRPSVARRRRASRRPGAQRQRRPDVRYVVTLDMTPVPRTWSGTCRNDRPSLNEAVFIRRQAG
jgi:hypothetical protein